MVIMVYYIPSNPLFQTFQILQSESESERTQHVLYSLKAWDSRISNMIFPCGGALVHGGPIFLEYQIKPPPFNAYDTLVTGMLRTDARTGIRGT